MPSGYWDDIASEHGFDWDDVESVDVIRGDDSWDIIVHTADDAIHIEEDFDDEEMGEHFWDDLYYDLIEDGIDVDRDTHYGEATA